MTLQSYVYSKYRNRFTLSELSGVPQAIVEDLCTNKCALQDCSEDTIQKLTQTLDCTAEFIMSLAPFNTEYDPETGLRLDRPDLEHGLPPYLEQSIQAMVESWNIIDNGGKDPHWDLKWCELNSDLNVAEVEHEIPSEQAWYLREKYLRMSQET